MDDLIHALGQECKDLLTDEIGMVTSVHLWFGGSTRYQITRRGETSPKTVESGCVHLRGNKAPLACVQMVWDCRGFRCTHQVTGLVGVISGIAVAYRGSVRYAIEIPGKSDILWAEAGTVDVMQERIYLDTVDELAPSDGITLADAEKIVIRRTLAMTDGNRRQAAKILNIGERTLYRKIMKYGLN